jgi:hypothetical protein
MRNTRQRPIALILVEGAIAAPRRQGFTTAADIARALNDQGIATPKGDRWHAMQVQRIITMGPTRANLSRR